MHDVTSSLQFEQMLMFHLFHRDRRMVRALGCRGFRTYQTPCSNTHLPTLLDLLVVAWTKHLHSIHLHPKKQLPMRLQLHLLRHERARKCPEHWMPFMPSHAYCFLRGVLCSSMLSRSTLMRSASCLMTTRQVAVEI
jgi:hypothetical protein